MHVCYNFVTPLFFSDMTLQLHCGYFYSCDYWFYYGCVTALFMALLN